MRRIRVTTQMQINNSSFLSDAATYELEKIGQELDHGQYPAVRNGGIVVPISTVIFENMGKEMEDERRYEARRPSTGSRQGTTRRKGSAGRSTAASTTAPVIGPIGPENFDNSIEERAVAYPVVRYWRAPDAFWLVTRSHLLDGCSRSAVFVSVFSDTPIPIARSWGFWDGITWIGPRHTNFPDGSVCSYEIRDLTWRAGGSIVTLLDMHTVWALRHLHLEVFGRWPGYQAIALTYERLLEIQDDEYCGCDAEDHKRYINCCKSKDLGGDYLSHAIHYLTATQGGIRQPPAAMRALAHGSISTPPDLKTVVG